MGPATTLKKLAHASNGKISQLTKKKDKRLRTFDWANLPEEALKRIFTFALVADRSIDIVNLFKLPAVLQTSPALAATHPYGLSPALLATCTTVYLKGVEYLYGKNTFETSGKKRATNELRHLMGAGQPAPAERHVKVVRFHQRFQEIKQLKIVLAFRDDYFSRDRTGNYAGMTDRALIFEDLECFQRLCEVELNTIESLETLVLAVPKPLPNNIPLERFVPFVRTFAARKGVTVRIEGAGLTSAVPRVLSQPEVPDIVLQRADRLDPGDEGLPSERVVLTGPYAGKVFPPNKESQQALAERSGITLVGPDPSRLGRGEESGMEGEMSKKDKKEQKKLEKKEIKEKNKLEKQEKKKDKTQR
ncbi:hypothetical protein K402DRAFT_452781 [Aulographum hederae CBS 113979]|uniref:Uncharacterized protein n=1 Tax=Aulographum hederae CBS 113979 TaxID=1176131 RepID=A0A6G1H5R1_9PEZI|nr:hypothetical protein K402DRAFT_452781 [Aulographum hederae CBS 113979]